MGQHRIRRQCGPGDTVRLVVPIHHNVHVVEVWLFFTNIEGAAPEIQLSGTPQLYEDQSGRSVIQALRSEVSFSYRVPADIDAGDYYLTRAMVKTFAGASYSYEAEELGSMSNFGIRMIEEPDEKPTLEGIGFPS